MQSWRTVRVFISSTFCDMHAERDLMDQALRILADLLPEVGRRTVPVGESRGVQKRLMRSFPTVPESG
jgi:hypothetical protein